jgi:hypothetical protein
MAQKAMVHLQQLMKQGKGKRMFTPYQKNQKVWLEATNLKMTHSTTKLTPKQYRPFIVKNIISSVIYQLNLPKHWKIHNVFYTLLLLLYYKTHIYGPNFEELPPELINDQPEWEVEIILDSRRFGYIKKLQYWIY